MNDQHTSIKNNPGAIAGIVIGVLFTIGIIILVAVIYAPKRKATSSGVNTNGPSTINDKPIPESEPDLSQDIIDEIVKIIENPPEISQNIINNVVDIIRDSPDIPKETVDRIVNLSAYSSETPYNRFNKMMNVIMNSSEIPQDVINKITDILMQTPADSDSTENSIDNIPPSNAITQVPEKSNEFVGYRFSNIKKVIISLPADIIEPINLAEVEFFDQDDNLIPAENINVTMSSVLPGYPGSYLIDGIYSTFGHTQNWDLKTVTFTFNNLKTISKIKIFNRKDSCCRYRINKLTITLLDENDTILSISQPINFKEIPYPYVYTYKFSPST